MISLPVDGDALVTAATAVAWPFLRTSALLMAAPVLSARVLPVQVRILLAFGLSLMIAALMETPPAIDPFSLAGLVLAVQQIVIGAAMGFILAMVFSVLAQAGENIALGMGLGFASINDPVGGVTIPVVSQYYTVVGTLVFLSLGGHVLLIEALIRSFEVLPVGIDGLSTDALMGLVLWGGEMLAWGVLISLPAVAAMLLVNLAFGVVTRAAPQLNVLAVGLPLTILLGFAAMLLTLPALVDALGELFAAGFALIERILLA